MDLDFSHPSACDEAPPEDVPADLPIARHRPALVRAHATLVAGCSFVVAQARLEEVSGKDHPAHARMTGNRLRELDRFLSVLIDEVAALAERPCPEIHFFARMRNTPEKLRRLKATDIVDENDLRLRAIGRISAYLRYCRDGIRRPGLARDILMAGGPSDREKVGWSMLEPSLMVAIAVLYRSIGDGLLASVDGTAP